MRWAFPLHCALCRSPGTPLCEPCALRLAPAPDPGEGDVDHLDGVAALFAYSGAGRTAITRLKFDNHRDALDTWAHLLLGAIDVLADVVTWVPTSAARRRQRGVDQAELLARAVGRSSRTPVRRTLRRTASSDQIGLDRAARRMLRFEPAPRIGRWIDGAIVLVVDDVRTTGASLDAAAVALRSAGAAKVFGATIAATPRR